VSLTVRRFFAYFIAAVGTYAAIELTSVVVLEDFNGSAVGYVAVLYSVLLAIYALVAWVIALRVQLAPARLTAIVIASAVLTLLTNLAIGAAVIGVVGTAPHLGRTAVSPILRGSC